MINENNMKKLSNIYSSKGQSGFVYDSRNIGPTLVSFTNGGGKEPIVFVKSNKS